LSGFWSDIGSIEKLREAEKFLQRPHPCPLSMPPVTTDIHCPKRDGEGHAD
jgi:hypothetical protein